MDNRTHLIMFGSYMGLGFLAMIIMPLMGGGLIGMLIGLMIMAGGGLAHEFLSRREGFKKVARAVVALRKTVDKTVADMDGIQKELGKAAADARSASQAATEAQETAKTAAEELASGGGDAGDLTPQIEQLQQAQQTQSTEILQFQQAGNQLHAEVQALQQQQAMLQQQLQHMQAMLQQTQQMSVSAAAAPPPPPQPQAAPPPQPAPPAAAPAPVPDVAPDEPAPDIAPDEPAAAPAPAQVAASAGELIAAVLQDMEAAVTALSTSDNLVDNSLRAIANSLMNDAVDLYIEPIVTLPERKLAHYECYGGVRADDGSPLTIDQHLDLSGREQAMAAIENALIARCLDRIETLDGSGHDGSGCFYNVAGPTLGDRSFFNRLAAHLGAKPKLAGKLVLEFSQAALMEHGEQAVEDLVRLQEAGCRFSIDEITDLEIDFKSLQGFGFRFIKVGSKFIRVQANTADDPETVRGLATSLRAMSIEAVVENVETDLSLVELIGFEVGLGQGPLFGQPTIHKPG